MATPEELLEQMRLKSQQTNDNGFTGAQLGMGAGQGILPPVENPFAVQTGVTPQAPVVVDQNQGATFPTLGTPESREALLNSAEVTFPTLQAQGQEGLAESQRLLPEERAMIEARVASRAAEDAAITPAPFQPVGGGFSFGGDTPIPADRESGFIPTKEEFLAGGTAEFANQGRAAITPPKASPQLIEAPISDPFGVTPDQIAQSGNASVGLASTQEPFAYNQGGYGVNSLPPEAIAGTRANEAAQAQASQPAANQVDTPQQGGDFGLAGFTPQFEGQTPSQFMRGEDTPESTTFQGTDSQGRLRQFASPEARQANIEEGQASFAQASADREARQAARPDFGAALSDRDRQAMARGETVSKAPTAVFKEEAEANGLTGRAKSEYIAEKKRVWDEVQSDRATSQASAKAAAVIKKAELGLKVAAWEQTQGESRQKRTDEMNTEIGALTSIIGQSENIGGVALEAGRQVGVGTTGFFSPLKWIGGTTAADLAGNLETIKSDAFVSNITEMRKNSPTGGAVGNVSDKDLEMLQSLQTTFRQNLKPSTLRNNLKKYKEIRETVVKDAKAGFVLKYGQENLDRYFGGDSGGATQSPSGASRHSNDQDHGAKVETHFKG